MSALGRYPTLNRPGDRASRGGQRRVKSRHRGWGARPNDVNLLGDIQRMVRDWVFLQVAQGSEKCAAPLTGTLCAMGGTHLLVVWLFWGSFRGVESGDSGAVGATRNGLSELSPAMPARSGFCRRAPARSRKMSWRLLKWRNRRGVFRSGGGVGFPRSRLISGVDGQAPKSRFLVLERVCSGAVGARGWKSEVGDSSRVAVG